MKPSLLLATGNTGKLKEFKELAAELSHTINIVTPIDLDISLNFNEGSGTYKEIARRKSQQAETQSSLPSMAEDAGLEVDALDGFPGIKSARFMGKASSYTDKIDALLALLDKIPFIERTARYHSFIAISIEHEIVLESQGVWEGLIATAPRGQRGFGYDPIFFLPTFRKTAAEISISAKNKISHRAMAFNAIVPKLKNIFN